MNTCLFANDNDSFVCKIYRKNYPDNTLLEKDIKDVTANDICRRGIPDVFTAGPPCQPASRAGKRQFAKDDRWLWPQLFRLVCDIRPTYIVLENPAGIFDGGFGYILGTLAALRYDAEWQIISAAAFGAPHLRERMFIIAYSNSIDEQSRVGVQQPDQRQIFTQSYRVGTTVWDTSACKVIGMDDGLSRGLDKGKRTKALGNSVVPAVTRYVAECITNHLGRCFTFAEFFCGIGGFRLGFEQAKINEEESQDARTS